jgi:Tol biopolymer transport system component
VSVTTTGTEANQLSENASISGDGRYVVFQSQASNLGLIDTNAVSDIFLHDRLLGITTRVSQSIAAVQANGPSQDAKISADGRYVTFQSFASNLVAGDANGGPDCFILDRTGGTLMLVSLDSAGLQGNGVSSTPSAAGGP